MILLALIAAIGAHGPKTTTMLGTDAALECPFTSGSVCETAAGPDVTVTTTRASTRMCWTGSAWQTVPANTPCIGRYGLASFGAGTNYVTNSTRIDLFVRTGGALEENADGSYRLTDSDPAANTLLDSAGASVAAAGETWTATFELRAVSGSPTQMRIGPGGSTFSSDYCTVTITTEWRRYSCTKTSTAAGNANARLVFGTTSAATGSVDIRQAQLEKSPTPGPRHDCGGSACSWQGDVHTVPPAGWPVEAGEVRLQYTPLNATSAANRFLLDTRATASGSGVYILVWSDGRLGIRAHDGVGSGSTSSTALTWAAGQTYSIIARWSATRLTLIRDGVVVVDLPGTFSPPTSHGANATIGAMHTGAEPANGSIRLLRVSE